MPTAAAAGSLSRSSTSARPIRPATTLRANSAARTSVAPPTYQSFSYSPKGTSATTVTVSSTRSGVSRPLKPPVNGSATLSTCWPMRTSAMLAMPR
jgi:hypothetical protein